MQLSWPDIGFKLEEITVVTFLRGFQSVVEFFSSDGGTFWCVSDFGFSSINNVVDFSIQLFNFSIQVVDTSA